MVDRHREDLTVRQEGAVLVGVTLPNTSESNDHPLSELRGLAKTAGARILGDLHQRRNKPDIATYLGSGKVEELGEMVEERDADVVLFDNELDPGQVRNLERRTHTKVVDRTELILDIFATRAKTHQARLQVELAQLEYLRPRLKRMWTHLERHGGGIGTRGPGEQQLETDRRLLDKRIRDLKQRLSSIQQRKKREVNRRSNELRVSLVGYTNAGKSTLMRRLTGADVLVANKLFATLDTRTRQWAIPGWTKVLLSDTVGFIRDLPHDLVESFKATLEEATHADLLLHVVDASNPYVREQIKSVEKVLRELEAESTPTILVLNQIDCVEDPTIIHGLRASYANAVAVSAATGEGVGKLEQLVQKMLSERFVTAEVTTHAGNGRLLAYLNAHGEVEDQRYEGESVIVTVKIARHLLERVSSDELEITLLDGAPLMDPVADDE
ncbi:GTPase HflX [Planctomycetes bacterium Pan216]|uniref:GTPase HflX n=1 Tax=Kolteria novifilia TaxID=2527975 RepID=A0A518BBC2_9BACT|nr:GTPase HflX [Planctomycetes bacterium Pan216]